MIYPSNFENKIQFGEIRSLLKGYCLSQLGKDKVDAMTFTADCGRINTMLRQTREFRRMQEETDDFPLQFFFDMRASISASASKELTSRRTRYMTCVVRWRQWQE